MNNAVFIILVFSFVLVVYLFVRLFVCLFVCQTQEFSFLERFLGCLHNLEHLGYLYHGIIRLRVSIATILLL